MLRLSTCLISSSGCRNLIPSGGISCLALTTHFSTLDIMQMHALMHTSWLVITHFTFCSNRLHATRSFDTIPIWPTPWRSKNIIIYLSCLSLLWQLLSVVVFIDLVENTSSWQQLVGKGVCPLVCTLSLCPPTLGLGQQTPWLLGIYTALVFSEIPLTETVFAIRETYFLVST